MVEMGSGSAWPCCRAGLYLRILFLTLNHEAKYRQLTAGTGGIEPALQCARHRILKYAALTAIAVSIILILSMIIWIDELSPKAMLIMRGCAGLGAVIFVVLVGTLTYRVNKHHIADRRNARH